MLIHMLTGIGYTEKQTEGMQVNAGPIKAD